ncbi:hypothetical protein GCM10009001_27700 [Virgibacillus siamensis]|uniref:HTH merR-type domain-containing protein n=1 Tax=Virgibacillus siamensis TaxID=480071 RepID=A0ABN1GCT1_9BACI
MKIGEFITNLNTTKDTVRHYEKLHLLSPKQDGTYKEYSEKEVMDFQAVTDMKEMGMTLKDIQLIFQMKQSLGCRSPELIKSVKAQLKEHLASIIDEEQQLHKRRINLEETIKELQQIQV